VYVLSLIVFNYIYSLRGISLLRCKDLSLSFNIDIILCVNRLRSMSNSILVVEDNDDLQILFRLVLESDGYKVAIANNGQDALRLLEETQPQLVLMDIMMPGISGIEVSRSIKQQQSYKTLPILLVSAVDRLKEQQLNYSQADGVLYKPFNLDDLVDKIEQLTCDRQFSRDFPKASSFNCYMQS
jgi:CheY-like chemotaxis protein